MIQFFTLNATAAQQPLFKMNDGTVCISLHSFVQKPPAMPNSRYAGEESEENAWFRVLVCSVWDFLGFWSNGVGTDSESDTYTHTHTPIGDMSSLIQPSRIQHLSIHTSMQTQLSSMMIHCAICTGDLPILPRGKRNASARPTDRKHNGTRRFKNSLSCVLSTNDQFVFTTSTMSSFKRTWAPRQRFRQSSIPRRKCSIRAALIDHRLELSKC